MEIEKLEKGDLRYKEGMRYKADFNGFILHFTEKALAELGRKIETLQNTSSNSDYGKCINDLYENYPYKEEWDKDDIKEFIEQHFA